MRCGNCHQKHQTVDEVMECYHIKPRTKRERTPVPAHLSSGSGPTPNQVSYLTALLEQLGQTEVNLPKPILSLSFSEASEVISRLKNERDELPKHAINPTQLPANITGDTISQGTYTVVFDAQKDDRITLRFREPKQGKWRGTQLVEYLAGPDNTSDYIRCANQTGEGYRVWSRFKDDGRITKGIKYLVNATDRNRAEAGMVYAVESSNCYRCGRTLTVPVSIHRGLGPECAKMVS